MVYRSAAYPRLSPVLSALTAKTQAEHPCSLLLAHNISISPSGQLVKNRPPTAQKTPFIGLAHLSIRSPCFSQQSILPSSLLLLSDPPHRTTSPQNACPSNCTPTHTAYLLMILLYFSVVSARLPPSNPRVTLHTSAISLCPNPAHRAILNRFIPESNIPQKASLPSKQLLEILQILKTPYLHRTFAYICCLSSSALPVEKSDYCPRPPILLRKTFSHQHPAARPAV